MEPDPAETAHPLGYWESSPNVFREKVGLNYEELTPGLKFEHRPGRTLTEMDNVLMSTLSLNTSPLHIDQEFAAANIEAGKTLMSSLVTLSIVAGMSVRSTSGMAIANLGWSEIKVLRPVFAGDTLYAESIVLRRRESRKNPNRGVVTTEHTGRVRSEPVITFVRSFLIETATRRPW
ncbi:MaoC family dehydratase [Frankia sp. CiP3]|uniref:MaoC family dehydratase n=1 Tax=Frankia sp. CiP3 TaxID=2880971 RepID=UPI001EF71BF1|nr:MaoC family dehydratase [Frankia sp. CiP3]